MSSHHASASKRSILAACAWWAQPSVVLPPDETGPAAEHGNAVHALVSVGISTGGTIPGASPRALAQAARVRAWLKENAPAPVLSEVAMVYDATAGTVREIVGKGHREYGPIAATELPGSADIIWLDAAQGEAVVLDIKTGDAPPASHSGQLASLGLMAATLYGVERARVGHLLVSDDDIRDDWMALTEEDLGGVRAELRDDLLAITRAPEARPGAHCRWCPARTICPATSQAMTALPSVALDTPDDVARVWAQLGPIEDAIDAVKKRVRAYVEERGAVTLSDGSTLRIVDMPGGETCSVKDIPASMAEALRDVGVIKRRSGSKQLRVMKGRAA